MVGSRIIFTSLSAMMVFEVACCAYYINSRPRNPKNIQLNPIHEVGYYNNPRQNLTIPIIIHIDHVLTHQHIEKYGFNSKRKLKFLAQRYLLEAASIFQRLSPNQRISFQLIDTRLLKNISSIVTVNENASKYLKSYCKWQATKKYNQLYYSVLLTGLDLFYLKNGVEVRRSTGRSYVGSVCSVKSSCTILEWHPNNVAYLLAHEIAHSLGIDHDGAPYNKCKPRGHIMNAKYNAGSHPRTWSTCSRRSLKKYLESERAWCLRQDYVNNLSVF